MLILAVYGIVVAGRWWRRRAPEFELDEAELGIGNHKIKFRPNYEDLQVAFRLWTELRTRKIGLPIDEEHDVIVEVYDSWYEFFRIARELIKTIPVTKFRRSESTQQLVAISVDVLNRGLRPDLTRWQARFRRWWRYAGEDPANRELSPQEMQRQFPEYSALLKDMRDVNVRMLAYAKALERMVNP